MSNTQRIAFNTFIQIIGKGITTAIAVVMLAYLARYLRVDGYGDYTTIFAFLGFFAIIADMGLYTVAVREMAKRPDASPHILGNIFSLRILFAILLLAIAPVIGWIVPAYGMDVKLGILVGTLASFFILSNQMVVSVFQTNLRMDRLVIGDIVARSVLLGLVLLFITQGYSLVAFVWANVIANVVLFVISFMLSRRFVRFSFGFDFSYWKHIIKEALPLGIIIVLGLIYFKIDTIMLSLMKDSEAVGIYGAPYKILEILITIPAMFMGSVLPVVTRYIEKGERGRVQESFKKSFDFMAILALPLLVGTFILAEPLVVLVLGVDFMASVEVLRYLIFAVFIIFFGTIIGYFAVAADLQRHLVWAYILSVVVNVVGNLILIPNYSYIGASIATIGTELLIASLAFYIVRKHLRVSPGLTVFMKALLASSVMGVVLYVLRDFNIFTLVVVGTVAYGGVLYGVKGVSKQMMRELLRQRS